jgi:hypothetical protein
MNTLLLESVEYDDLIKYEVTLITGHSNEDLYVEGIVKFHIFNTESEAQLCFHRLRHIIHIRPYLALKQFNRFRNTGVKNSLGHCAGLTIRHCVTRPDGSQSVWEAVAGEKISYSNENSIKVFDTIASFVSAHYIAEHPTRRSGNAWEECEAWIGDWVKMAMIREILV